MAAVGRVRVNYLFFHFFCSIYFRNNFNFEIISFLIAFCFLKLKCKAKLPMTALKCKQNGNKSAMKTPQSGSKCNKSIFALMFISIIILESY